MSIDSVTDPLHVAATKSIGDVNMHQTILAPAAVLVLWSLLMMLWMVATRLPALSKVGIDLKTAPPGGRGADLDKVLPPTVNWKAHNYMHLMEQPTLFYAVVGILAISGHSAGYNLLLAWGYVGLRILHSIWQATVNTIPVRFSLFFLSSLCLIALAIHAVMVTL
jgi:uncharacterized MAPEG superfamily protein